MTKIVCVSDTHNQHFQLDMPKGDVLVHAGDITFLAPIKITNVKAYYDQIIHFDKWCGLVKKLYGYKEVICIPGNHDFIFDVNNFGTKEQALKMMTNARMLIDQEFVFQGLKFYGSPWTPRFYDWAFNLDRGEPLKAVWDMIPSDTDVLITHGPPYQIRDYSEFGCEHVGCLDLQEAVQRIKPKLHVFGHIHGDYGEEERWGIKFVNACSCTEKYKPENKPIIVEI